MGISDVPAQLKTKIRISANRARSTEVTQTIWMLNQFETLLGCREDNERAGDDV